MKGKLLMKLVMQVKMSEMDMRAFPGRTHRFVQVPVLYPFGHGLSYTTWNYTGLTSRVSDLENGRMAVQASVIVQNTGEYECKTQHTDGSVQHC